jgi:HEAT repeat protein
MQDLTSADASKRASAILNIVAFRENAAPAVPALLARFLDPDTSPRVKAIVAFRYLPEIPPDQTPRVVNALAKALSSDTQTVVRYEAAVTLNRFAGSNKKAVQALIQGATRDRGTWEIRTACVSTLRGAGWDPKTGPDPEVTRALLQALKDPTHEVRLQAIMNLGFMGSPADPKLREEVYSALQTWSRSRSAEKTSVLWAYVSLVLLGGELRESALDAIAKYLRLEDSEMRVQGIHALAVLGEKARSKAPDLVNVLGDTDDTVVVAAAGALALIHDPSDEVLRSLIKLTRLDKDRASVVVQACLSLSQLGKPAPEVVKALEAVNQRDSLPREVRYAADAALKQLLRSTKADRRGNAGRPPLQGTIERRPPRRQLERD